MTTITLEIPDELAMRIAPMKDRLPEMLAGMFSPAAEAEASGVLRLAARHPAWQEMMDFLAASPGPREILRFRLSPGAQERLTDLLDKNREAGLTPAETVELDVYELIHHSVIRLRAQARQSA